MVTKIRVYREHMGNRTVLRSSDCQNHREMKRIKESKEKER